MTHTNNAVKSQMNDAQSAYATHVYVITLHATVNFRQKCLLLR